MELRQLRYFLAVHEERHLTRAAYALGIRPTSLSQQIIALERVLGAPLFVRTPGGMTPTEAADRLVADARAAVEAARRAKESVHGRRVMRAALTPGAPPWVAPALWRAAGESTPEIADRQTGEQLVRLRAGSLDVGVVVLPEDLHDLACVEVGDAELGVLVAGGHRLARRSTVDWADLSGSALLWFARSSAPGYHDATRAAWTRAGWRPRVIREGPPRRALFTAELAGGDDMVALRPAWDAHDADGLVWLPFATDAPRIRHALVWNADDSYAARYAATAADLVREARPQARAGAPRGRRAVEGGVLGSTGPAASRIR
ncbi:LysR family transcriptional regulator [Embleya sp. NPDC050154]|uniref:LysR family transcriptional regulator n=1 Tax=Embleya sp. NPDC050154 TaxID=3363988 RepID=UPI003788EA2B